MQNIFSITYPSRGWAHIRWGGAPISRSERDALAGLARFPGVAVYPDAVQIPRTLWHHPSVRETVLRTTHIGLAETNLTRTGLWMPKRIPFTHQVRAAELLVANKSLFLCDPQGLGKTGSAILGAETVRRETFDSTRPVIIIGPLFVRDTWRRELLAMGAIDDDSQFCGLTGRNLDDPSWKPDARYYFVHYDVAQTWWTRLDLKRPCCVIVDEAHWAKNGRSLRGKSTMLMAHAAPYRILSTGTPMENRPSELWHLLTTLEGTRAWGSPVDFRRRYCGAERTQFGWKDQGSTNETELRTRLEPIYLRRKVEDIGIEIPSLTRQFVSVQPSQADALFMSHLRRNLTDAEMRRLVDAIIERRITDDVLQTITHLRIAASEAKLPTTIAHVTNLLDQEESVVVFCWRKETVRKLAQAAASNTESDMSVHALTGDVPIAERDRAVQAFQEEGGAIIATYGVLKEGVTLHRARHVTLHDFDWVPSAMLQAEKRIHRIGQPRACTSTWMVAEGTIDRLLVDTLYEKLSLYNTVFDERIDALTDVSSVVESGGFEARVAKALENWRNA